MRQIILDTETTGLEYSKGHRLTEIGCLEMKNRRLTGRTFQYYLNPEREIDPGAFAITGLSTEFLKDKPKFAEIVDEFLDFIGNAEVIIHNAPFDLGFINYELSLMKHPVGTLDAQLQIIDTLKMARLLHPGQKNNLDALCRRYNIDNSHRTYHGALLDAEILAKVYLQMTAGQSALMLDETFDDETLPAIEIGQKRTRKPRLRLANIILKVIYASAEENALHEQRMQKLLSKVKK